MLLLLVTRRVSFAGRRWWLARIPDAIANAIPVSVVTLRFVTGIANANAVLVFLPRVWDVRAVVAGIADIVAVGVVTRCLVTDDWECNCQTQHQDQDSCDACESLGFLHSRFSFHSVDCWESCACSGSVGET